MKSVVMKAAAAFLVDGLNMAGRNLLDVVKGRRDDAGFKRRRAARFSVNKLRRGGRVKLLSAGRSIARGEARRK
jgi:hypothetical protein